MAYWNLMLPKCDIISDFWMDIFYLSNNFLTNFNNNFYNFFWLYSIDQIFKLSSTIWFKTNKTVKIGEKFSYSHFILYQRILKVGFHPVNKVLVWNIYIYIFHHVTDVLSASSNLYLQVRTESSYVDLFFYYENGRKEWHLQFYRAGCQWHAGAASRGPPRGLLHRPKLQAVSPSCSYSTSP